LALGVTNPHTGPKSPPKYKLKVLGNSVLDRKDLLTKRTLVGICKIKPISASSGLSKSIQPPPPAHFQLEIENQP
jgi:hypothetical protein